MDKQQWQMSLEISGLENNFKTIWLQKGMSFVTSVGHDIWE